eukprot:10522126-Lingulodinium_polyedra.AAC.1
MRPSKHPPQGAERRARYGTPPARRHVAPRRSDANTYCPIRGNRPTRKSLTGCLCPRIEPRQAPAAARGAPGPRRGCVNAAPVLRWRCLGAALR